MHEGGGVFFWTHEILANTQKVVDYEMNYWSPLNKPKNKEKS